MSLDAKQIQRLQNAVESLSGGRSGARSGARSSDRPLIVFDVDEVLCPTARQFADLLSQLGYRFRITDSWFQNWEIDRPDGSRMRYEEIDQALLGWFERLVPEQPIYPEAPEIINKLQQDCDVLILTNIWESLAQARVSGLEQQGIDCPLIWWTGSKAPALDWFAKQFSKVAFVDDNAGHINAVKALENSIFCDHFIANPEIRALSARTEADTHSDDWPSLREALRNWFTER